MDFVISLEWAALGPVCTNAKRTIVFPVCSADPAVYRFRVPPERVEVL